MTTDQATRPSANAKILQELFDATARGDADAMRATMHPEIVLREPDSLPHGGLHRGVDAFFGEVRFMLIESGWDLGITDQVVIDGGEVCIGQMNITYTSRRTGRTISHPYLQLYRFRDGLVSEIDVYPKDSQELVDFMTRNR